MRKVPLRFATNDVIKCTFNPFRKTLMFAKNDTEETCILNVNLLPNDKLYPCVRISYANDSVEFMHE